MNNISLMFYLADITTGFKVVLSILAGVFFLLSFVCLASEEGKLNKFIVYTFFTSILCVFSAVIIPSKETIYLIASSQVAEQVVSNPEVKQVGSKILTVINSKLDDMIEETVKKSK